MVPGSQGTDYRACRYAADSERWGLEHIRLSRDRISNRDPRYRILYAESTRRLEAQGLDADSNRNFAPREPRFHAERGAQDLAVVGALAASLSKHVRRHFGHFAGGAPFSGTHQSKRDSRCQHGRIGEYRQRSGARLLGVDFRFDHEARNILRDVRWPGSVVLVLPQHRDCLVDDDRYIRGVDVLRRRIWHDAGV